MPDQLFYDILTNVILPECKRLNHFYQKLITLFSNGYFTKDKSAPETSCPNEKRF
jgi:hypothetical protein